MAKENIQWLLQGSDGLDSLKLSREAPIPPLGPHSVLVRFQAASINYRDIIISQGKYPLPTSRAVVPGSDGAGVVEEVGAMVTLFRKGDKVVTHFNQGHQGGVITPRIVGTALGSAIDGTFRQHGVFEETGLVKMPENLSFEEASTLTCCGLTAWNALFGLSDKSLKAGQYLLVQGTGGISMFAIQFALSSGAIVIATTSSDAKMEKLKQMGVQHTINYNKDPEWGVTARNLTPGGEGVDQVIVIAGLRTVEQSLEAIRMDGLVNMTGFVGDNYDEFTKGPASDQPSFAQAWVKGCVLRNGLVGSRPQFEDMNRAIEANNIRPVVDPNLFKLEDLKEAYKYLWAQKHIGKVVIQIPEETVA